MNNDIDEAIGRYESVFCVFMAAAAFLWRGLAGEADPALLALFAALLAGNLAAARALRRWPGKPAVAAAIALSNCGVVAAIVGRLGGAESQFWVLYLLPIYSSCMLLGSRQTALIAGGAVAFVLAGSVPESGVWGADDAMGAAVKSAVLSLACVLTLRLAERERQTARRLEEGRARARELEFTARIQRQKVEDSAGLADAGLLSAGVAHDLNNTLTVILGFADIALACEGVAASVRSDLGAIRRSAVIAQRIAATLLGISRKTHAAPQPLDLNEMIQDVMSLLRPMLRKAGVTLSLEFGSSLPRVLAGRTQLQRLLLNLASNAARAMSETGGRLLVQTRLEPAAGGAQVIVTVEDSGPGLPEPVLARLFQPFARGGAAEGHGLGLYLCWEIARDHGGRLHGENKPEGGARFTLFLPALEAAPRLLERA